MIIYLIGEVTREGSKTSGQVKPGVHCTLCGVDVFAAQLLPWIVETMVTGRMKEESQSSRPQQEG